MRELDAACVQGQPREAISFCELAIQGAFPVIGITDDGVMDMLHVPSNLVETTGLGPGLDPCNFSRFNFNMFNGVDRRQRVDTLAALGLGDRVVDDEFGGHQPANQRVVSLDDCSCLELFLKDSGTLAIHRKNHDAGGGAVESMNGVA